MNITREHVKGATGMVATFGGGALTGAAATRLILTVPNPLMRIAMWVGSMGIGVVVGAAAKKGTDELIDAAADLVEEIKNR